MAKKMLGKVVAGAALGGASLLVFTPGMAYAGHHDGEDDGKVHAKPGSVHAGDEVKLIEICDEPQEHTYVWSEVTGKVKLHPAREHDRDEESGEHGRDGKDEHGRDGKDEHGRDGKDDHGKGPDGKDDHGKDDQGKGPDGRDQYPKPPADGWGGGMAGDAAAAAADRAAKDHDWKGHEESGQEEESEGHDRKGDDDYGMGEESGRGEDEDGWKHKKDFVYYGEARVATGAAPGTYKLKGLCGDGELTVLPTGGVDGGDGGMTSASTDRGLAAGGASLLGAAALGGIVLMRRRRADGLD